MNKNWILWKRIFIILQITQGRVGIWCEFYMYSTCYTAVCTSCAIKDPTWKGLKELTPSPQLNHASLITKKKLKITKHQKYSSKNEIISSKTAKASCFKGRCQKPAEIGGSASNFRLLAAGSSASIKPPVYDVHVILDSPWKIASCVLAYQKEFTMSPSILSWVVCLSYLIPKMSLLK